MPLAFLPTILCRLPRCSGLVYFTDPFSFEDSLSSLLTSRKCLPAGVVLLFLNRREFFTAGLIVLCSSDDANLSGEHAPPNMKKELLFLLTALV